jgi:sugar phosphate permease
MWGLTLILSGIAQSVSALITARTLLGVGEAFVYPVANTFVANWFPVKERGRANSIWFNGMSLGPTLAGALVVAVVGMGGWRLVFYVLAALSIVLPLPLVIFLMRDRPDQQPRVSKEEVRIIEGGTLAKTREVPRAAAVKGLNFLWNYRFWLVTLSAGFHNIFFWGWSTWMPTYFQTARHFSFKTAGYLFSLNYLFMAMAVLTVGYLSDKVMRRAPFGAAGWIAGSILVYVGGSLIANPYVALVALIIAVAFTAPAYSLTHALLQSIVPEGAIGPAAGFSNGIALLMSAVSPALVGFILQVSGFGAAIIFLASAAFIPGVLMVFLARKGY